MADVDLEAMAKMQELIKEFDSDKSPSRKELLEMLDVVDLSDDMKEKLRSMLIGDVPKVFDASSTGGTILAVLLVIIIFSLILFFGYKLYKSIQEKERKKEEKKKAKQMKKKK